MSAARLELEASLLILAENAWDSEVRWAEISKWLENFSGMCLDEEVERDHCLLALTRFIYFGKRLLREMLKSLYRDHFEAPTIQNIRKKYNNTKDTKLIRFLYEAELRATRFIGLGNPSESGAHLLYYFRQVNGLPKDLFVDLGAAFVSTTKYGTRTVSAVDNSVRRYVFFDDLVGTADQSSKYLTAELRRIRASDSSLKLRFMSLFATDSGLQKLNNKTLFDGDAMSLFELDDTYRAFSLDQRYFGSPPKWFDVATLQTIAQRYGERLRPGHALGYKDGQLLLGFTHNTPDNTLPIFWDEGRAGMPWSPIFLRYDKQ